MITTPKILIIEDNPLSRKLLRVTLETECYIVVDAADGTSGLREATQQKFDLIIQDLFLPDMDGYLLNKLLRALPTVGKIPIFGLSGFINQANERVNPDNFTLFLLKPVEPSHLITVIKAHLLITTPSLTSIGEGKHILIADDNAIQLKLLAMQLRNLGFEVSTAQDGAIAFDSAMSRPPDAIISDVLMPNIDGFNLCLKVRREAKICSIPVLLLTSHYLENEDIALANKVGVSYYTTRTPEINKLIDVLLEFLNNKSTGTANIDEQFVLTEEIKEKHTIRSMRQLEHQVRDNSKLAQRCAQLASQLSLIDGIVSTLTKSSNDFDKALNDLLYFTLDATGVSKGALYIKRPDYGLILSQQLGYTETDTVQSFFGLIEFLPQIIDKKLPCAVPSEFFSGPIAQKFLDDAGVKFALIVPMFSGSEFQGVLFLGSDLSNLSDENIIDFVRRLGMHFGQSIALASVFDRLDSSEKRYRQIVEISPDAIFIQQDGKFTYANRSALNLLSADNIEVLAAYAFDDFFPADFKKILKEYLHEIKKNVSKSFLEGKIINLNKDILDVEIVVSPFMYQERAAVYLIMRDITERKQSALHLEIQYAIASILAESPTLFIATAEILKIICTRLNWDCGTIWAVDQEANVLRCSRVWQGPHITSIAFQQECQQLNIAFGKGLPGKVWKDRKAIWQEDILQDEQFLRKKSVHEIGLDSAVIFPIIYENEVLGVIDFFSRVHKRLDSKLLLWFESIGHQFGLFLKRKHMENQMLFLAEHDVLTGLSNRNLLEQYLNSAIENAKDSNKKLAVLFLDLDHFKYVNDSMGHQIGDLLLIEIAQRLHQCLRPEDKISRLGGDEFIIILPDVENRENVIDIINRMRSKLASQIILKGQEFVITTSIGISFYPADGNTVEKLIKVADIAMYAAKEKGRNNYQFSTSEMTLIAENRGILLNSLRHALEEEEFLLYYQPKINVTTQQISGMEALIRWKTSKGIILPGTFMPAAEDSEVINPIGEWTITKAFLQNQIWQTAGLTNVPISINLSVRNLNFQLLHHIERLLIETNLNPELFEFELTEGVLMDNVDNNIQILRNIKEMGFKISIDDFGTGYSSLSYLKCFPIDILKIDQSFVRDIATDPDDAAIVTAIIGMARSLGFKVIAEGVETEEQLKFLSDHGCDEIQGYFFSRPLPALEATEFIIKNRNAKTKGSQPKLKVIKGPR
jgi:diguanylate cyclase (GGDEF)-like protein/PAS domain S-box-containing protein